MLQIEIEMIMMKKEKTKEDLEIIEKFFSEETPQDTQKTMKIIAEISD